MPRNFFENIRQRELDINAKKEEHLRAKGWSLTCSTPGSLWLWSHPHKGGIILVSIATALYMQEAVEGGIYSWEET
jgi:hypothetical protein